MASSSAQEAMESVRGACEEDDSGCARDLSDDLHADDLHGDDSERASDDDEDAQAACDEDEELEREWAAMEIQHAWRACHHLQQQQQQQQQTGDSEPERSLDESAPEVKKHESVCCSCFGLIEEPHSASNSEQDAGHGEDQAFCAACLYTMAKSISVSIHSVSSPLPKISMLVHAEAKYQDQLQLLRAKQELLCQQQQEMQSRKSAQAKQLAAERAIARERRRLFQLSMERKRREEELKYHSLSGSPEQEDASDGTMTPQSESSKPNKGKRKKMKEIIPIPLRRTLQQATTDSSSPLTLLPGLREKSHASESHEQQQQRKTHFLKKMVGCYAQDLTPLVNGHKPKLLPVPSLSPAANCSSSSYKKPQQSQPSLSRASPQTTSSTAAASAKAAQHSSKKKLKSKTSSHATVKLLPIDVKAAATHKPNNQHEEHESVQSFSSYSRLGSSSPLTAEIKPISWIYELGKGVLDDELSGIMSHSSAAPSPHHHRQLHHQDSAQPLARFAQLDAVQEEPSERERASSAASPRQLTQDERRPSFDLRLRHRLPPKTVLSSASPSHPSEPLTTTAEPAMHSNSTPTQPQWEYSTDRLASLLEKYNVSVTSTTR